MLDRHAPPAAEVVVLTDERYGDEDDMLLDVVRPAAATGRRPLLLWVHGGGWVGGSKDELLGYFKLVASHGYVVAGPRYSLAPEHRYPTPPRQMMQASATCRSTPSATGSTRNGLPSRATPPAPTSPPSSARW